METLLILQILLLIITCSSRIRSCLLIKHLMQMFVICATKSILIFKVLLSQNFKHKIRGLQMQEPKIINSSLLKSGTNKTYLMIIINNRTRIQMPRIIQLVMVATKVAHQQFQCDSPLKDQNVQIGLKKKDSLFLLNSRKRQSPLESQIKQDLML